MNRRRGSAMVEAALVTSTFIMLLVAITDFGRMGFALNSVTYAAHRAARFAATRGSSSGHTASASDVQANVLSNIVGLDTSVLTVDVLWAPDQTPGSKVQVAVTYKFKTLLIPISANRLTLKSTAVATISQ
jgi:Flp pilus assembly protein TadG